MRAVVQRVSSGSVSVENETIAAIDQGLMILLGIEEGDTTEKADYLARKIANLRIFADSEDKMNLSLLDINGGAIVISQFTLMADTQKGNRPSFIEAAPPELADEMVNYFISQLQSHGVETQSGRFGAHMELTIHNNGPVTILFKK